MQTTASPLQRSTPTQAHGGSCVILSDNGPQRVLCIQQVMGVAFLGASERVMALSAEDGRRSRASDKHTGCQCDSRSNYGIIQCKLLGDNNKSGLTHHLENLGLTSLPVIC